ncbi:hypothetical protein U1Q18_031468 [Sarracenia purpurea var. burkii]
MQTPAAMPSQHERIDQLEQRMDGMEGLEDVVEELRLQMEDISGCVYVLMRAMSNAPTGGSMDFSKARVPEPRSYGGARDAKEPDNFLFDIEQYFKAVKADSEESMTTLSPSNETLAPRTRVGNVRSFKVIANPRVGELTLLLPRAALVVVNTNLNLMWTRRRPPHQGANKPRNTISYFLCNGRHKIADCPQRHAFNATASLPKNASQGSESESESEEDSQSRQSSKASKTSGSRVDAFQMMNALEKKKTHGKGKKVVKSDKPSPPKQLVAPKEEDREEACLKKGV